MTDLFALPVISVVQVASRQALLVLDAKETPVHASHTTAGQHLLLQLANDDVPRAFAIANAPDKSGRLEFLIKLPEERMGRVLTLMETDKLRASTCVGRGFPFDAVTRADLWLCGGGSGIAPLRAALEFLVADRQAFGQRTLLYGVRTPDELCFRERFGVWAGLDVHVIPVVSQPPSTWDGAVGYVQQHLPSSFARPAQTHAFVCGLPDMEKAICAELLARGVGPDQVHRNW